MCTAYYKLHPLGYMPWIAYKEPQAGHGHVMGVHPCSCLDGRQLPLLSQHVHVPVHRALDPLLQAVEGLIS